jgi:hypothetical protein
MHLAIGAPMLPTPMKPIFFIPSSFPSPYLFPAGKVKGEGICHYQHLFFTAQPLDNYETGLLLYSIPFSL